MKTFIEFVQAGMQQEGIVDFVKRWTGNGQKKPTSPAKPAYRSGQQKDSSAYRTDHHHYNGDIEPTDIPEFKPTWNKKF